MINSLLDDDLYKFTMQQAILQLYPNAVAEYRFKNRGEHKFNAAFLELFSKQLQSLKDLRATDAELKKLAALPFIKPWYVQYLRNYRYNPEQVWAGLHANGDLSLTINGPWHATVLWEVKLMAIISECYFSLQKNWDMQGQDKRINDKLNMFRSGMSARETPIKFADFGTRRRRSYATQDLIVKECTARPELFVGTSNVHLAFKYGVSPIGTMAHEWVQGISVLESLNHANRYMMKKWRQVYGGRLGIALTDTFGTNGFLEDFNIGYAKLFDGVRHDSGDPILFMDKIVQHYERLGINPKEKTIVFSDGLTAQKVCDIVRRCDRIKCSFGIGTHLTNDFDSPALNMVIKLWMLDGQPVVKLSDTPGKNNGEPGTVKLMKQIYSVQ